MVLHLMWRRPQWLSARLSIECVGLSRKGKVKVLQLDLASIPDQICGAEIWLDITLLAKVKLGLRDN